MNRGKTIFLFSLACILFVVFAFSNLAIAADPKKVDINSATKEELMTLKSIGEKVAANIIAHREKNGPFQAPEDIMKVKGIGPKIFEKNKDRIMAGLPATSTPAATKMAPEKKK